MSSDFVIVSLAISWSYCVREGCQMLTKPSSPTADLPNIFIPLGDILGAAIQEASASKKPAAKKKSKNDDAEDAA
jgi:hypothetical protein